MSDSVRELVTKFSFDADHKPIQRFDGAISRLKTGIAGISFGMMIKEVASLGFVADQTRRNLNLMLDGAASKRAEAFLMGLNRHTSSMNDSMIAYTKSVEELGDAAFTERTMQPMLDIAAIKGMNVKDIRDIFDQAIKTGDFSRLIGLGLSEFNESWAMSVAGLKHIPQEMKKVMIDRLDKSLSFRNEQLANALKDADVQLSKTGSLLEDIFSDAGQDLNKSFTAPFLTGVNHWIEENRKFGFMGAMKREEMRESISLQRKVETGTATEDEKRKFRVMMKDRELEQKKMEGRLSVGDVFDSSGRGITYLFDLLSQQTKQGSVGAFSQTNNITVNGGDPKKTEKAVKDGTSASLKEMFPKATRTGG